MPSSNKAPRGSPGRGFASLDPERQCEVLGQVRRCASDSPVPVRQPQVKPAPAWARVLPDVEAAYEGGSSRHWR